MIEIEKGARGKAVTDWQRWLDKRGYPPGAIDGHFSARTMAAVEAFQAANHIPVHGTIDEITIAARLALDEHNEGLSVPIAQPPVSRRERARAVLTRMGLLQPMDGPEEDKQTTIRVERKIDTIVVHCSASDSDLTVAQIDSIHRSQGYSSIGYHYYIRRDGAIEHGRDLNVAGAHVRSHNQGTVGICLAGCNHFTVAQVNGLHRAIASVMKKVGKQLELRPHNSYDTAKAVGKTCPNFNLESFLAGHLEIVEYYRGGGAWPKDSCPANCLHNLAPLYPDTSIEQSFAPGGLPNPPQMDSGLAGD